MNQGRFESLLNGMTAVAKKVFSAIPKTEAWHIHQVHHELARQQLVRDVRIIDGCIDTLVSSGLVIESPRGHFRQVSVKPRPIRATADPIPTTTTSENSVSIPTTTPRAKPPTPSPLDRLAALSKRVGEAMTNLKAIASDLEEAAIEIEDEMTRNAESAEKLRQLQQLLKGVA